MDGTGYSDLMGSLRRNSLMFNNQHQEQLDFSIGDEALNDDDIQPEESLVDFIHSILPFPIDEISESEAFAKFTSGELAGFLMRLVKE